MFFIFILFFCHRSVSSKNQKGSLETDAAAKSKEDKKND
jgi:hypothetical protein